MIKSVISDYICLCSKVKKKDYINFLIDNKKSFEEVSQRLKVGINCSACRIELEKEFIKIQDSPYVALKKNDFLKYYLNKILNTFSSKQIFINKKILRQVAPIFSGDGINTNLIISNYSIGGLSKYNVPHIVKVKIINKVGKIVERKKFFIDKEQRLVYKLNIDGLKERRGFKQVGSVWTETYSLKFGYIGVTRPHIRLTTKSSISTLHMQHGRTYGVSYNPIINNQEEHLLSLINLENVANKFFIYNSIDGKTNSKNFFSINPYSSKLINLKKNLKNNKKKFIKAKFFIEHSGILRRNIIIRNVKNNITSMDHI